jgi:hypothetical protein
VEKLAANGLGALRQPPEAGTESVTQLVSYARSGRIRIPEFQRPLRWQAKDVQDLFDSIYRGLPIGSLLFWRRPASAGRFGLGPLEVEGAAIPDAWWVVDGQQRITSLAAALARELPLPLESRDPYVVFFDPFQTQFLAAPTDGSIRPELVPLPALFDAAVLSEWVHGWALARDDHARRRVFEAGARIRDFRVPRYLVEAGDDAEGHALLHEIFYRINKKGRALEWQEVHDALYGDETSAPTRITDLADELFKLGMGRPPRSTLTTCLLAVRGLDVTRPLSEHRDKDPDKLRGAVADALPALRTSLEFLRRRAEIPHLRLLPRAFVLNVLTRFFFLHPKPAARSVELLRRWLWRALVSANVLDERTVVRGAIAAIDEDEEDSLQRILRLVPANTYSLHPPTTAFDARASEARLAAIALASFAPRDLRSADLIDVAELLEMRGALAFASIVPRGGDYAYRGAENRLFARTPAVRHAIMRRIDAYGVDDEVLRSHAIEPEAAKALRNADFSRFLRLRDDTLEVRLEQLVPRLAGTARGDHDRPSITHLVSNE